MIIKKWNLHISDEKKVEQLVKFLKIGKFPADLLVKRGYETPQNAEKFISKSFENLQNPFNMKDMDKAVERINQAKEKNESIVVYGDYDVDGITSTYIFYDYLKSIGLKVSYYIPDRKNEGYGLNSEAVLKVSELNASLMITVDTGITAVEEVKLAKSLGMDVIITDHHECKDVLPDAYAVVNPRRPDCKYDFKELAGVGVAFKVIAAHATTAGTDFKKLCNKYLEFVALGTVADVMPITEENRIIVHHGVKNLNSTRNIGLKALLKNVGIKNTMLSTTTISFGIAPRLNAAGRISRATRAVELFTATQKEEAEFISDELSNMNRERQYIENKIYLEAVKIINSDLKKYENVIFLYDKKWHQGVIGIVASKLLEQYSKPVLLMTSDDNITFKGSGRSMKGSINLVNALTYCSESNIVKKFGGHEFAAGFSVEKENLQKFENKLNEYVVKNSEGKILIQYEIDKELSHHDITLKAAKELNLLEPYGNGNELPLFLFSKTTIVKIISMGTEEKHQRVILKKDDTLYTAIYFNIRRNDMIYTEGDEVDILCNENINNYMDNESVQLTIRDIRYAADENTDHIKLAEELYVYDTFRNKTLSKLKKEYMPSKEDFANIYNFIKLNEIKINGRKKTSYYGYYKALNEERKFSNYFKFRIICDVLSEFNILTLKSSRNVIHELKINKSAKKVNLEDSPILINLKHLLI